MGQNDSDNSGGNYAFPTTTSSLAIWSLVLGVVGLVLCLLSIFTAIPAIVCGHMALSRIKADPRALGGTGLAIAGLITGYLSLLIIPMLAVIAIPNFVKARNTAMANICYNNLKQIDAAKNAWALDHRKPTGAVPTEEELKPYLKNGVLPVCPAEGTYTIGAVGDDPTCSVPGHGLPGSVTGSTGNPNGVRVTVASPNGVVKVTVAPPQPATAASVPASAAASNKGEGFVISAMDRSDMVCDSKTDILYISSGDSVVRYSLDAKKFLDPWVLGGDLRGIDLSPDGKLLAVADAAGGNGRLHVHLVDVATGGDEPASFTAAMQENGTYAVAFGADGQVWITSSMTGSGWVPLRKYNPQTHSLLKMQVVSQDTMLTPSADRQSIGMAEANVTPGSYGRILYRATQLPPNLMRANGFLYEIGISRDGKQIAAPEYRSLNLSGASVPSIDEANILGVVYHPLKDFMFVSQAGTSLVSVYETGQYTHVKDIDMGEAFASTGNHAFQTARLKVSPDGKYLFCTVRGGVRCVELRL